MLQDFIFYFFLYGCQLLGVYMGIVKGMMVQELGINSRTQVGSVSLSITQDLDQTKGFREIQRLIQNLVAYKYKERNFEIVISVSNLVLKSTSGIKVNEVRK
eukprot:TRINITY_DN11295_c0_g1_i1.p3 TRINITY_DN11295_c0_g1~~TRINITY_DN11295_c0_g1_i1.p3  ORF type:complete len:102 (-),score=6.29 TRINITY_DN11295_c0_g1_i1:79-384(-)